MVRIARVVVPGMPHHLTQRGNRRQQTFFSRNDYAFYIRLMAKWCAKWQVRVWAYCLMPNHVHLVVVPDSEEGLSHAIAEAHRSYTRRVNLREGWQGHLWQGRFSSFVMDDEHTLRAMRYIELNPVKAGLASSPEEYPWSSARAHLMGQDDLLVSVQPILGYVGDWQAYLALDMDEKEMAAMRRHERTGRPLNSDDFLTRLEQRIGRRLKREKPGPKRQL